MLGKPTLYKAPLVISDEVASALGQMQRQFDAANVALEYIGHAENARVCANSSSVKAIVHSLVGNALDAFIEFGVTEPCVTVNESVTADHYVLRIADNGGGIDEEHLQHIFDPFFTTKTVCSDRGWVWRWCGGWLKSWVEVLSAKTRAKAPCFGWKYLLSLSML